MSSETASRKKTGGHIAEHQFAQSIGGQVNRGSQQDKKDVIDCQHRTHSVKKGRYWQIFLYRRSRLLTNTILQGIAGGVADALIACLDAFPETYEQYIADKKRYKTALQEPMRELCKILQNETTRRAFYEKALFNGGEVNYLSAWRDNAWHIFPSQFVVNYLASLEITNSIGRSIGQFSDQKVLIKDNINIGEIELRNDSPTHYREVKFRIDGEKLMPRLIEEADAPIDAKLSKRVLAYEQAKRTFKVIADTPR